LELGTSAGGQKTRMMATRPRKKFDDIFSRLDTMHQRDRRTDGRTDRHWATAKTTLTHGVAQWKPKHLQNSKRKLVSYQGFI